MKYKIETYDKQEYPIGDVYKALNIKEAEKHIVGWTLKPYFFHTSAYTENFNYQKIFSLRETIHILYIIRSKYENYNSKLIPLEGIINEI